MKTQMLFLILLLEIFLFSSACDRKMNNLSTIRVKTVNSYTDEYQVNREIDKLTLAKKSDQAYKFIDTLISLNPNNGFLFYQKGYINTYFMNFGSGLYNFKIAQNLKYSNYKCQKMIKLCEALVNDSVKFSKEHPLHKVSAITEHYK